MKRLHIAALVAVGALGGALITRWQVGDRPEPAPLAAAPAVEPLAPPAVPEAVAPEPVPPPVEPARKPVRRRLAPPAPVQRAAEAPRPLPEPPAIEPAATPAPRPSVVADPPPPPAPPRSVTLPSGTLIPVRLGEGLSTARNQPGDTFTATLDQPLVVDGLVIAERGARLEGSVIETTEAGRVKGVASLAIHLTQLRTSDGQQIGIETETFRKEGDTSVRGDAAKVGAAAGIGAAIGAIAGGGKGAAIGAAIGGATGTGGVLATRGKAATLASETRISFRLSEPVTVVEKR
ncbi:MAG: hypothetical protein WD696_04285 [Bryobacteraceae bacterium]